MAEASPTIMSVSQQVMPLKLINLNLVERKHKILRSARSARSAKLGADKNPRYRQIKAIRRMVMVMVNRAVLSFNSSFLLQYNVKSPVN